MTKRRRHRNDGRFDVRGAEVQGVNDQVRSALRNADPLAYADRDYGFSGRCGFQEGFYSSYYGRGTAGERDRPSPSGYAGAGYERGGTDIPRPDREPRDAVRIDDEVAFRYVVVERVVSPPPRAASPRPPMANPVWPATLLQ